jgi:hypothetical protein
MLLVAIPAVLLRVIKDRDIKYVYVNMAIATITVMIDNAVAKHGIAILYSK